LRASRVAKRRWIRLVSSTNHAGGSGAFDAASYVYVFRTLPNADKGKGWKMSESPSTHLSKDFRAGGAFSEHPSVREQAAHLNPCAPTLASSKRLGHLRYATETLLLIVSFVGPSPLARRLQPTAMTPPILQSYEPERGTQPAFECS